MGQQTLLSHFYYDVRDVLLAAGELERSDASAPVEGAVRLQIFGREPEGAIIHRVNGHRAIVAPAM